eukprot:31354-Pelagococcus_subviridis.AAC.17
MSFGKLQRNASPAASALLASFALRREPPPPSTTLSLLPAPSLIASPRTRAMINFAGTPMCMAMMRRLLPVARCAGDAFEPNPRAATSNRRASCPLDAGPSVGNNSRRRFTFASARYPAESLLADVSPRAVDRSADPRSYRSPREERRVCIDAFAAAIAAAAAAFAAPPPDTIGFNTRAAAPASSLTSSSLPPVVSAPKDAGDNTARHRRRAKPPVSATTHPMAFKNPSRFSSFRSNTCCARTMTCTASFTLARRQSRTACEPATTSSTSSSSESRAGTPFARKNPAAIRGCRRSPPSSPDIATSARLATSRSNAHRAQCKTARVDRIHAVAAATSSSGDSATRASAAGVGGSAVTRNGHPSDAPRDAARISASHLDGDRKFGKRCTSALNAAWDSNLALVSTRAVPWVNIHSTSGGNVPKLPPRAVPPLGGSRHSAVA